MSLLDFLPARCRVRELRLQLRVRELEHLVAESLEARAARRGLVYAPMSAEVAGVMMRQSGSPPVVLTVRPDQSHPLLVELVCQVLAPVVEPDQIGVRCFVFMPDGACILDAGISVPEEELERAAVPLWQRTREMARMHRQRAAAGSN